MKKILTLTMVALLFLCVSASAKTLIDWSAVNGMIRSFKTNYFAIEKVTNAYKNDFYVALTKVSNFPAGLYQSKKNSPHYRTNWKLVQEVLGTNIVHLLPLNAWRMTNVTMMAMTNALHVVQDVEVTALSNGCLITATNFTVLVRTNLTKRLNSTVSNRIVATNTLRTNIYTKMNLKFTWVSNGCLKIATNSSLGRIAIASNGALVIATNFTVLTRTNLAKRINTGVSNRVVSSNIVHVLLNTQILASTNSTHMYFSNIMNVWHTNALMIRDANNRKWRIVVTNGVLSAITNPAYVK